MSLHAAESVDYTPDQVENLLDALHDIDAAQSTDAGSQTAGQDQHGGQLSVGEWL